jgi:hypothetical protein
MDVVDLSARRAEGGATIHLDGPCVVPHKAHHALGPPSPGDRFEECGDDLTGVDGAHCGMDQEPEARGAIVPDVLDELIMRGATAEARRERFLEHADRVAVEE